MSTDKPSRNEDEYFAQRNAELINQQRSAAEAAALEAERKSHYMKCPKDGYDLASSEFHGVQIETCPKCGGMWLDAGELDTISHEDRPALLTRVLSDAFSSLRGSSKRRDAGKPVHDPANPLS
ncbi:MAG: zf-TFIIB domain-containing protein [Gemmatimonadales bacterium]